jgi:hypothetical protein
MDLRRRSKNRVVEAMARAPALAIGQEPARPNCDVDVDRMDSVAEGRNESVEPCLQRFSPFRMTAANLFDDGFEFDERGCGEEQGLLMSLDPGSEGGPFWRSRREAFEQGGVDQPGVQTIPPQLSPGKLELDLKGIWEGQQGLLKFRRV